MAVPELSVTGGSSDEGGFADATLLTTLSGAADESYDKLDFSRPERELRPHYTSSSTLKSVKSTKEDVNEAAKSNKWNFNHRHSFVASSSAEGGRHYQTLAGGNSPTAKHNMTSSTADPTAAGLLFDTEVFYKF